MPEHAPIPILPVLHAVIGQVRRDPRLSAALDEYAETNPESDNVGVRWLSRKRGYEITLKLGAEALSAQPERPGDA